jgi:hypothetical protein
MLLVRCPFQAPLLPAPCQISTPMVVSLTLRPVGPLSPADFPLQLNESKSGMLGLWNAHVGSHRCEAAVAGMPSVTSYPGTTLPARGTVRRDAAVVDPLPAAVECSYLQALHFVECLHWSRLKVCRCPTVPQEATTAFQLKSQKCEIISTCVWLGSRVQWLSTPNFSWGRMRGLHERAACMQQMSGANACIPARRSDVNGRLGNYYKYVKMILSTWRSKSASNR